MATRNHSTNGAHTLSEHIKTALGIGLRTRPRLISVSPRYIFCLEYLSASRIASLISFATVIRVLKHEEKVAYEALQYSKN